MTDVTDEVPDYRTGFSGKTLAEIDPEQLAMLFHGTYERLAPSYGWATQTASRTHWDQVPEANRQLMIATAADVLDVLRTHCAWDDQ
jgi:hypothetical protein